MTKIFEKYFEQINSTAKSRLIEKFKNYLEENSDISEEESVEIVSSPSIYTKSDEFKEFLKTELLSGNYSVFGTGFSSDILDDVNYSSTIGKVSAKTSDEDDDANLFSDIMNNLLEDEDFKATFDTDGDGKISHSEYEVMLAAINSDDNPEAIMLDEIFSAIEGIKNNTFALPAVEQAELIQNPDYDAMVAGTSAAAGGSGSTSDSNLQIDDPIDAMSIEELEAELSSTNGQISDKEQEINSIQDESALSEEKAQLEAYYDAFCEQLKAADAELSEKVDEKKQAIDSTKNTINETKVNINNKNSEISTLKSEKNSADTQVTALDAAISSLQAEISSLGTASSSASDSDTSSKKAELQSALQSAQAEKAEQEKISKQKANDIERAEGELQSLQDNLSENETLLQTQETEMSELEEEVNKLAQSKNPDGSVQYPGLAEAQSAYEAAQKAFEATKETKLQSANADLEKLKTHQSEIQTKLDARRANKTKSDYSIGMSLDYTFDDGTKYNVVGIDGFDSLEEFQQAIIKAGLTNTGEYGTMQCFNYSQIYGNLILGTANSELTAAFLTGQNQEAGYMGRSATWNQRSFQQTAAPEGYSTYDVLAAELEKGNPCVVGIPRTSNGYSTHYGLCVGIREGATAPYTESDFLIIDSYDGNIEKGGVTNSFNQNRSVWTYTEGFHYYNGDNYKKLYQFT